MMVPPILAPLLPFSPHTKTSLKPSTGTTIPHRRVWLPSPQASQSCRHTFRHLLPAVPSRFVWQCRLPDRSSHHTVASVLFLSCTWAPCQGPQLCGLLHCCCRCRCTLWNASICARACLPKQGQALQVLGQCLFPPFTVIPS
uniref:Uncharacterized protein n=1 Tax=Myotis myotis TaxID=51298 RepID=A0A7J7SS88_MYOMY|nr:hypothetical protein mMyoMyo1_009335 [Myotis myotis]